MKDDVSIALQKKAEQIRSAAESLMSNTRDWQVIKQFMCNRLKDIKLTQEQEKKLERYQFIYNQLVSGKYTDAEVVNQLTNKKFYGLSISQAYEDMNAAKEIFPSVININKRFELHLSLQLNQIRQMKAEAMGDMKALAAFEKNRALLLKEIPDEEENPGEMFDGHTIEAVFDPALLGAPAVDMKEVLKAVNEKRDKKIKIDMFDELEFVESK